VPPVWELRDSLGRMEKNEPKGQGVKVKKKRSPKVRRRPRHRRGFTKGTPAVKLLALGVAGAQQVNVSKAPVHRVGLNVKILRRKNPRSARWAGGKGHTGSSRNRKNEKKKKARRHGNRERWPNTNRAEGVVQEKREVHRKRSD